MIAFAKDFEWYRLFYLLGIALGAILVLQAAKRDGLSMGKVMAMFVSATVFGVLGSRLAEIPLAFWDDVLLHGNAQPSGKTMLGGIVGALIGLWLAKTILGLKSEVFGWFMLWPATLIVFRTGCLFVGCCAGSPTDMFWGLSYPSGTPACDFQHAKGLLAVTEHISLPVHPVPVFEMVFAVLALAGIYFLCKRNWERPRIFFLSLIAYACFRFFEEFIRTDKVVESGLNSVQIGLLVALPILIVLTLLPASKSAIGKYVGTGKVWFALALPLILVLVLRNFWTAGEWMGIGMVFGGYAVLTLVEAWSFGLESRSSLAWALPSLAAAGMLLMSQAAIDQTVSDDEEIAMLETGLAGTIGRYQETCGDNHDYGVLGTGAVVNYNWGGKHEFQIGAGIFGGYDRDSQTNRTIFGGNPYLGYQNRWAGIELGASMGSLVVDGDYRNFVPSFAARLGPSDIFFAEVRVYNNGFVPVPGSGFRVGIGSGFGIKNGTVVRAGLGINGWYFHPSIVLNRQLMFEPLIAYGEADNYQMSLGLRWRFGLMPKKEKTAP
jgi:phosphatidylglycerol:prolipoprotein diacylglycerol transferase